MPGKNRRKQRGTRRLSHRGGCRNNNNHGRHANNNHNMRPAPRNGGGQQHGGQQRGRHCSEGGFQSFGTTASEIRHAVYKRKLQDIKSNGVRAKEQLDKILSTVDELDAAFNSNMEWEPVFNNIFIKATPSLSPHPPTIVNDAPPPPNPPAPTTAAASALSPTVLAPLSSVVGPLPVVGPGNQFYAVPSGSYCRDAAAALQTQSLAVGVPSSLLPNQLTSSTGSGPSNAGTGGAMVEVVPDGGKGGECSRRSNSNSNSNSNRTYSPMDLSKESSSDGSDGMTTMLEFPFARGDFSYRDCGM